MKKALNIIAVIAFVFVVGIIVYLKMISEDKSIYISTGFGSGVIAKVDSRDITKAEVMVLLADAKIEYEDMFGADIWSEKMGEQNFDEYAADTVKARITRQKCMVSMAQARGIVLSSTEELNVEKAAAEYMELLTREQQRALGVNKEIIENMYTEFVMADRLFDAITLEVDTEVSEDQARVISIQYIRTMDRASADKVLSRINNGESFLSIVKENNSQEYEYELKRGETEDSFEQAAFSLATGEISDVVETSTGFYVIMCINDYDKVKTASNKEQIISERKLGAFNEIFDAYEAEKYAEYDEKSWNSIDMQQIPSTDAGFNKIFEKYFK